MNKSFSYLMAEIKGLLWEEMYPEFEDINSFKIIYLSNVKIFTAQLQWANKKRFYESL